MKRTIRVGIVLAFFLTLIGFSISTPKASAATLSPGCYTLNKSQTGNAAPGWATKPCQDLVTVFPEFVVAPEDCYFTWETDLGPSAPVKYKCDNAPAFNAKVVQPKDGKPGNGPEISGSIERNKDFNTENCKGQKAVANDNCIIDTINVVITIVSGSVALIVILVIITAGIQYIVAAGDPAKISKAKTRIRNAVFALVAYMFLYGFLQWVVPGGI